MADEKAEKAEKEAAPEGPKRILGLPLPQFAFVAANLLVMLGGMGYIVHASLIYKKPPITETVARKEIEKVEKKRAAVQTGEGYFPVSYSEMTVTLRGAQGGKSHFATVEATLVCGSEGCKMQVEAAKAKVEDAIQSVLSSRSYTELASLETKFRVKHEILARVNAFLIDTAAIDVLFTAFVIQ